MKSNEIKNKVLGIIDKNHSKTANAIDNLQNNPAYIFFMEMAKMIPFASIVLEEALGELRRYQEMKKNELLNKIFEDYTVTKDMIDYKGILAILKCVDATNKLIVNEKVRYYGALVKNLLLQQERNYDEFEENLRKLGDLSYREIDILEDLYNIQIEETKKIYENTLIIYKKTNDKELNDKELNDKELNDKELNDKELNDKENGFIPNILTEKFLKYEMEKYSIGEMEVKSMLSGIISSGFCLSEPGKTYQDFSIMNYFISSSFVKFRKQIEIEIA